MSANVAFKKLKPFFVPAVKNVEIHEIPLVGFFMMLGKFQTTNCLIDVAIRNVAQLSTTQKSESMKNSLRNM